MSKLGSYVKEHFDYLILPNKFRGVDLLRATAVILVICHHFSDYVCWAKMENLHGLFIFGYIGVDLFFVISGFLIGGILVKELQSTHRISSAFYLRRMLRILPLYWAVTFATIFILYFRHNGTVPFDYLFRQFALDITFLHTTLQYPSEFSAWGSWPLAVEEWFYLFTPFILFCLFRLWSGRLANIAVSIVFLIIAGLLIRFFSFNNISTVDSFSIWMAGARPYSRFDELLIGVFIALIKLKTDLRMHHGWKIFFFVTGVILIVTIYLSQGLAQGRLSTIILGTLKPFLLSVGFSFLLVSIESIPTKHPLIQGTVSIGMQF